MNEQISLFLNEEPEDEITEFKTASKGRLPEDIWESVTGFSNSEGGRIIYGIKPDSKFQGLNSQEIDLLQRSIISDCSGSYNHTVYPQITKTEGTIQVFIPPIPANLRPLFSKKRGLPKGAKVRIGSSNVQVDDEWLRRFAIAARGGAETLEYDEVAQEVLDEQLLERYITRVNNARGNVYSGLVKVEILKKLRVISKSEKVTLFGLLAFSKGASLQEIVAPTVNLAITHYRGTNKASENNERDPFIANKEFYGSTSKIFEESFRYLLSTLPIKGTIDSGKRNDYLLYPRKL